MDALVATLAVLCLAWILALAYPRPVLSLHLGLAAYLVPLTDLQAFVPNGIDTRLITFTIASMQAARLIFHRKVTLRGVPLGLPLLGLLMALSTIWSRDSASSISAVASWSALVLFSTVMGMRVDPGRVSDSIFLFLAVIVSISAMAGLGGLSWAWSGERLTGVFINANGLGLASMLLALYAVGNQRLSAGLLFAISVSTLIATGSRAALIGAVCGVVVTFVMRLDAAWRIWVLIAGTVLVVSLMSAGWSIDSVASGLGFPDEGILRSGNSREDAWNDALTTWRSAPVLGVGAGAIFGFGGRSSYLTVLAEVGLVGLVFALGMLTGYASRIHMSRVVFPIFAAALLNAAFESWLFAGGSFFALIFYTALQAEVLASPGTVGGEKAEARFNRRHEGHQLG